MSTNVFRSVSVVLVGAALLGACGGSDKTTPNATTSASAAVTTTTAPAADLSTAVWPTAASATRYRSPTAAARGFAVDYLHFVNPIVGAFQAGDSRSGEVPIRATAPGPVTTVLVRQLGADGTWWVLGSNTPNIVLTSPAALATIASPVRLQGTSTAFEATVQVSIRQDDAATPLVDGFVMGGSNGVMGPFDKTFSFATPTSAAGAIVLFTVSAADGHVAEASVSRVKF